MVLNDFFLIEELALLSRTARFSLLNRMGDEAAAHFERVLPEAFARFQSVILLTHVPPFRESCWYEGQISDDSALPHFSCKAVGDVLLREMSSRPDRRLTVLCGHTHGGCEVDVLPNLRVLSGASRYGKPVIQGIIPVS